MRPAFRIHSGVWALTNSKPFAPHLILERSRVSSEHFKAKGRWIYLTKALPTAYRYNNVPGGHLILSAADKKFLGLNDLDTQIFSLNLNNNTMKVLPLKFEVVNPTNADLGISAEASAKQIYELVCKHLAGEPLSPPEEEVTKSEIWAKIQANVQRVQIHAVASQLPFATIEEAAIAAIPVEKLDEVLDAIQMVTSGNPAEAGSDAELGVEVLSEHFGAADLTAYQTPANPKDVVDAVNGTTEEAADVPTTDADGATAPAPEEPAASPTPEKEEDTATSPAIKSPVQAEVVPAKKRLVEVEELVTTMDKLEEMEESVRGMRKEFTGYIKKALVNLAGEADQATAALPEKVEADLLAVEA